MTQIHRSGVRACLSCVIDKVEHAIYLIIWRDKYAADAEKDIGRFVRKGVFGFDH